MTDRSTQVFTFLNDSISYIAPSWEEMSAAALNISQQMKIEDKKFDVLVTLSKGGWPLARVLADCLNISMGVSLGIAFYTGLAEKSTEPIIYQDISPVESVRGKNVVLFDDVSDSGESLVFAKKYLTDRGAKSVSTATLYFKSKTVCVPDFHADTTDAWIIFPFEIAESIRQLRTRWSAQKSDREEQNQRFVQLGFDQSWIDAF